jgi:hypothetical protein
MSKTVLIVTVAYAFTVMMAAFVFLTVRHVDTVSLVMFAIGLTSGIAPNVGSLIKAHETGTAVNHVASDVGVVMDQTTGAAAQQLEHIQALETKVNTIENVVSELKGSIQHGTTP